MKTYVRLSLAAVAAAMFVASAGCVREDGLCPDESSDSKLRVTLTVFTGQPAASRADRDDDKEDDGTADECFIDFAGGDYRVVLFDRTGTNRLFTLGPMDNGNISSQPSPDGSLSYRMEYEIEFPEGMGSEEMADIRTGGFKTLVLANWRSAGGTGAYDGLFEPDGTEQKLDDVWKDGAHYNFTYNPGPDGKLVWRPDRTSSPKRLIPMFGFAQSNGFIPGSGGRYESSATIRMQRAMAKIEVYDRLENQPKLVVSDVTMSSYNGSGRFIPDVKANPDWDKVGRQVTSSSIPQDVTTYYPTGGLHFFRMETASDGRGVWVAYVPEMALDKLTLAADKSFDPESDAAKKRAHIDISIATRENETIPGYTGGTYVAHFAKYLQNVTPTIPDDSWNHILRNHIYRFEVNKVGLAVDLHLHVIPWEADADEVWDYTDQVTIQRTLSWEEYPDPDGETDEDGNVLNVPGYESFNPETGEVMLWLDPARAPLKGSFKITTPLNGRWYVRLVPIDGSKTDAVSFVDVDKDGKVIVPASPCLEISGLIANDRFPDSFYIMPTHFDNDFESRYRLEFHVENLGVWTEVPMTPDNFKYYTIVRQGNLIVE